MPLESTAHQSSLTSGESLLLGYLRDGVFDAELAVRLGLTIGQVKDRISALMARAAVTSRADLLAWEPGFAVPTIDPVTAAPILAPPPPIVPAGRAPSRASLAAALVLVAALAAGGWWSFTAGGERAPLVAANAPSPPPGLSAATSVPSSPLGLPRATSIPLTVLPPATLPAGLVLYVFRACDGCDGPPAGIYRVFRDGSGAVVEEPLFTPDVEARESIVSAWASEDAADMVVAVCVGGSCGPGNRAEVLPASQVRLIRSRDGGVTWAAAGAFAGGAEVLGTTSTGEILLQRWTRSGTGLAGLATAFVLHPSGQAITPPAGAAPNRAPFVYAGDAIGWYGADGETILDEAGDVIQAWLPSDPKRLVQAQPRTRTADTWAFRWYPDSPYPDQNDVVTRVGEALADGTVRKVVEYIGSPLRLGPWVGAHTMITMVDVKPWRVVFRYAPGNDLARLPAMLDFERATLTPLGEPFNSGKNDVLAALSGNFLRIGAIEGCVPVLAGVAQEREPIACLKAGAIAGIVSVRLPVEGQPWIVVRTPSGRHGWVMGDQPGLELLTECTAACGRAISGAKGDRP